MATPRMTITPAEGTWVVRAGGAVIGESTRAMELVEGDYPPVVYFPREDLGMSLLERSATVTTCPHKGEAIHYDMAAKSGPIRDIAWSYENPKPEVEGIRGMLAFYPERAAIEEV